MEAKQKAIQAAYGDAWEKVKNGVGKQTGWCDPKFLDKAKPIKGGIEFDPYGTDRFRPKILAGIADNNGWTRCDEQIPHREELYMVCIDNQPHPCCYRLDFIIQQRKIGLINVTHWKILPKQEPPIY